MGLLFEEEADLIFHHSSIALNNTRQVHEGISHLTRSINHPRLLGLSKESLQTFADDRASDVQHQVGHITLVIANKTDGLIVTWVHGLSCNEQRTFRLHEHAADMTQRLIGDVGRQQFYLPFHREFSNVVVEEGFGDGDIDMHRGMLFEESFVDQAIAIPARFCIVRFRQRHSLADESSEGIGLWECLTIELVYPSLRTVC